MLPFNYASERRLWGEAKDKIMFQITAYVGGALLPPLYKRHNLDFSVQYSAKIKACKRQCLKCCYRYDE